MSQVDSPLLPLPLRGLSHAVVFFDEMPKHLMTEFTNRMRAPYPDLLPLNPARWGAASSPRSVNFGELAALVPPNQDKTRWHLLVDSQGVAPEVKEAILAGPQSPEDHLIQKLEEARAAVMVFLLEDGAAPSTPMSRLQALCQPVWCLLDMGARGVAFPEGGTVLGAETLRLLQCDEIGPGHSYLFVSSGLAHRSEGKLWFRTHGMAQFGLPDLCHAVVSGNPEELEDELTRTRLVLETLPPEMIAQGGVLPQGGEVVVGQRVFRAVAPPEDHPKMRSRFGFSFLE